ncbi:MAG: Crp/Fnr family transcriptional regulator [Bacteroidales bacterium]|nr:MAG: Crp/Fnr family transcriptional regulator [Bacteroidales bacterium]
MMQRNTQTKCIDCEICTNRSNLFNDLSAEDLSLINKDRYSIRFNPREIIIKQGTSGTKVLSVVDGLAKLYIEGFNKKNLILAIAKPWEIIGGPGVHTDNRNHYSVSALVETTVCFIDRNNFNEVLMRNARFADAMIRHISYKTISNFDKLVSLTQKQMHGRMADALLYLSEVVFEGTKFNMLLSRQDLADLSGMSKDSAIRILKEFENDKIIQMDGKKLNIPNISRLKDISVTG